MAVSEIQPISAVKITRNFLITCYRGGRKISYHFKPSTQETSYNAERGKVVIQWFDGYAIENVNDKRYRVDGTDYQQLRKHYYPLPSELKKAMVGAYIESVINAKPEVYFVRNFAKGALQKGLNISEDLADISIAYLNNDKQDLSKYGINTQEAACWHGIACVASVDGTFASGFDKATRRSSAYIDWVDAPDPSGVLSQRIKELRCDGYHNVADILENSIPKLVHEAQVEALKAIWRILMEKVDSRHGFLLPGYNGKSSEHQKIWDAFASYMQADEERAKVFKEVDHHFSVME